jgi:hypothetical protein
MILMDLINRRALETPALPRSRHDDFSGVAAGDLGDRVVAETVTQEAAIGTPDSSGVGQGGGDDGECCSEILGATEEYTTADEAAKGYMPYASWRNVRHTRLAAQQLER